MSDVIISGLPKCLPGELMQWCNENGMSVGQMKHALSELLEGREVRLSGLSQERAEMIRQRAVAYKLSCRIESAD
jgi:hypothetical protein